MKFIRRAIATAVLGTVYLVTTMLSRALRRGALNEWQRSQRILVIGTFHNPSWFHSHIRPLARSGVGEVVLVCDEDVDPIAGLRYECPPRWLARIVSRAGAKFIWAVRCGWRYRPDLYMGYHIFPCAVSALAAARLFGRPACYQATSGSHELEGGGWHADNRLLAALGKPSPFVERAALAVMREFDSIVVRGSGAETYMRQNGFSGELVTITGSVVPPVAWRDHAVRPIDMVFVGQLIKRKQPERFVSLVARVARDIPALRAVMIGDGPEMNNLRAQARHLGIEARIEFLGKRADVDDLLAAARVFVLTSRWEGVSIAMLEAMAAGAVPVVSNVGDLGDLVRSGVNGFIFDQDDLAGFERAVLQLLSDVGTWRACSTSAAETSVARSGTTAIAERWGKHLTDVMAHARATWASP